MRGLPKAFHRVAKVVVSCMWFCMKCVYGVVHRRGSPGRGRELVILAYHGVRPEQTGTFARQLDMVLDAGVAVSVAKLPCALLSRRAFGVTFDDGFGNVLENAVPALAERNIPATIFVPSGNLGRARGWQMTEGSADASERVMTPAEVRAAVSTGLVTIGSHTVSHRALTGLDASDLDHELCASRADLEKLTGHSVDTLAFPCGAHDERVLVHARRAGYERTFSIEPTVHGADADEFLMGRVLVEPDDWPVEFWLKLRGGYEWLALLHQLRSWGGTPKPRQ